jgi:lipoyl(octanoyl) transferase
VYFGTRPYLEAVELMEEAAARAERLILIGEHPPVYTRGARATQRPPSNGIPVIDVRRGGDLTYHGPGQLCAHIVAPYTGSAFTRAVEQAVIDVLAAEGVEGHTVKEYPGVWVGERKIASLGFKVNARWVAGGGVALNASCDLEPFRAITPCGIEGVEMTSLKQETGRDDFPGLRGRLADRITEVLK